MPSDPDLRIGRTRLETSETLSLLLLVWLTSAMAVGQLFGASGLTPTSPTPPADADPRSAFPAWVWGLAALSTAMSATFAYVLLGRARELWRELRRAPHVASNRPEVFLETTVWFLLLSPLVGLGVGGLMGPGIFWPLWLQWGLGVALLWPVLRSVSAAESRWALGWTLGRSFPPSNGGGSSTLRRLAAEVGWGLAVYVGSWPVLAASAALSAWIAVRWFPGHHPVADWMLTAQGFDRWTLFMVALVWAPIMEETIFRGAFFHYLCSRWSLGTAALVSASLFALLHPQGPAGWPFLVTLGVVLALLRRYRQSIVACLTMHCAHNGVTLLFLIKSS